MYQPIDSKGLSRIVSLELSRMHPATREEAQKAMVRRMGPYDLDGTAIKAGVDAYFATRGYAGN
ncbi:MAG: hypothetical protein EP335_03690 [Alphaproteobacteria bacterium]|nr:MAG: hypothetical protein EP335_03690 [Alphaproteobacteria bacterium]